MSIVAKRSPISATAKMLYHKMWSRTSLQRLLNTIQYQQQWFDGKTEAVHCLLEQQQTVWLLKILSALTHGGKSRGREESVNSLWLPYVIGGPLYFCPVVSFYLLSIYLLSFFSSPNLSGRRLDVYHTLTHGVALVRI